jgi:hypothetical protein
MSLSFIVKDFNPDLLKNHLKISNYDYFFKYFSKYKKEYEQIHNKKLRIISLIENEYIDKFYLKDYSKYYAEGFFSEEKNAKRAHFFLTNFNRSQFQDLFLNILNNGSKEKLNIFKQQEYLGHIVIKPIENEEGYYLVGRTNLKHYLKRVPNKKDFYRRFITNTNIISLFGIDLEIESLPFHQQDIAVGACASAGLWVTQFAISNFDSIPIRSLAEISERAKISYDLPTYPNEGLQLDELGKYITDLGLPYHVIEVEDLYTKYLENYGKKNSTKYINQVIEENILAYTTAKFPILCLLHLVKIVKKVRKKEITDDYYHVAVISGYREEHTKLKEIYLHDDQIGPYCQTKFLDPMIYLKNNWNKDYDKQIISTLLIPVDPLIKMSHTRILEGYNEKIEKELITNKFDDYWIFLSHISKYKKNLLKETIINCTYSSQKGKKNNPTLMTKEEFLQKNFPKYVWIIRFYKGKNEAKDIVLDSTTTMWNKIGEIFYI